MSDVRVRPRRRRGQLVLAAPLLASLVGCGAGEVRNGGSLVVLTHPDDELAIIDYLLEKGPSARLLFLTRGETAEMPSGRGEEAAVAGALYGSAGVDLLDAPAGPMTLDPSTVWESWRVSELIERIAEEIDRRRPAEVVTWMPNAVAVHGEHQVTGAVVTAACLRARHPPRRILFAYQSRKVGYYRMAESLFDPGELGMRVERFAGELPLDRLMTLYPSAKVQRWLADEAAAYRAGTQLIAVATPGEDRALTPPIAEAPRSVDGHRVVPHFGSWLREIGLDDLARVVALLPPTDEAEPAPGFDPHQVRRRLDDGVLYLLLPRDAAAYVGEGQLVPDG